MNISGILVQAKAENVKTVAKRLEKSGVCDVFNYDNLGRIVVTIEGDGINEEIQKLKKLQEIKGVISADMHYSYSEDELELAREEFEKADKVPEMLEDDTLTAQEIRYNGDLRKKNI
jgi:nitrate reductase NapD